MRRIGEVGDVCNGIRVKLLGLRVRCVAGDYRGLIS